MDGGTIIERLNVNLLAVDKLTQDISSTYATWKPSPEKWSIVEIVCHLLDEEREDFRARLDLLLHRPDAPWPSINPEGWVPERDYIGRDLRTTVGELLEERNRSIAWLRKLEQPAWTNTYEHRILGTMSAGDMLAAWLAHDYLHLKQLAHLQWQLIGTLAHPHSARYAGEW
ncbi:DinB family protein [Candidatus Eisenbacteria bacterium]|uniref:DinB family protein n=1 Tax=Eiseniibacteriota bacterium TaxID=2212470 RepID=A0ABV6YJL7_UNCEI